MTFGNYIPSKDLSSFSTVAYSKAALPLRNYFQHPPPFPLHHFPNLSSLLEGPCKYIVFLYYGPSLYNNIFSLTYALISYMSVRHVNFAALGDASTRFVSILVFLLSCETWLQVLNVSRPPSTYSTYNTRTQDYSSERLQLNLFSVRRNVQK